jgi:hypothetical protein
MTLKKVYFFIETGYQWGKGIDKDVAQVVYAEMKKILTPIGFTEWKDNDGMSAPLCGKGEDEGLYCHPMDLVGIVDIDTTLPLIEEGIKQSKILKYRHTNIHDIKQSDITWHERKKEIIRKDQTGVKS